jgi:hypothetical protein
MNVMRPSANKRSWLQWSLRSSLAAMLVLGVAFAWWGAKLRKEARIKNAVQLISVSPGWWVTDDYDPIAVVRAVNALYGLGRHDAIKALRQFAKENPTDGGPDARLEALRVIIPLLFGRADPEDKFPSARAYDDPGVYRLDQREWPFFTGLIFVEGDIPFHLVPAGGFSGSMGDFSYAIDWAEKSGRFRSSPLMPTDSLFAAADQLVLEIRRLKNDPNSGFWVELPEVKRRIRQQVLTAVVRDIVKCCGRMS